MIPNAKPYQNAVFPDKLLQRMIPNPKPYQNANFPDKLLWRIIPNPKPYQNADFPKNYPQFVPVDIYPQPNPVGALSLLIRIFAW